MKYIELIKESTTDAGSYKAASKKHVAAIIRKYNTIIRQFVLEEKINLFRGLATSSTEYFFVDTSNSNREAKGTNNYSNILTTKLDCWNGWPKRTNSIICSTNHTTALSFGSIYYVIPLTYNKIAVSNHTDFWNSVPANLTGTESVYLTLDEFNDWMVNIIKLGIKANFVKGKLPAASTINPDEIINALQEVVDGIKSNNVVIDDLVTFENSRLIYDHEKNMLKQLVNLGAKQFLETTLDPAVKNKLISNVLDLSNYKNKDHEVWFSGTALLVDRDIWDDFVQLVWKNT
jgi:hypothetical protein